MVHYEAAVLALVQLQVGPLVRQRMLVLAAPVQLLLLPPDSHCEGHVALCVWNPPLDVLALGYSGDPAAYGKLVGLIACC